MKAQFLWAFHSLNILVSWAWFSCSRYLFCVHCDYHNSKWGLFLSSYYSWGKRKLQRDNYPKSYCLQEDWTRREAQVTLDPKLLSGFSCRVTSAIRGVLKHLGFPCGSTGKESPATWEIWFQSPDWEDPIEKGKATQSSILDWRIPWTV